LGRLGELVPEEMFLWTFMVQGEITEAENRGRHTDHPGGRHSIWTKQWPISIIPPFLRWMPFLSQASNFILAWDRHQICWLLK